jgi:mRNA-degrading endonuclease YafQ of YafQ-DinJ toxin-antitoxin module
MAMKKYEKSIKGMLNKIVDKETAQDIFEKNFPEETKEEIEQEQMQHILTKLINNEKLGKNQKKFFKKYFP